MGQPMLSYQEIFMMGYSIDISKCKNETGCVIRGVDYDTARAVMKGMQARDKDNKVRGFCYRIRARGPRTSPEVVNFYLNKMYQWDVNNKYNPYPGTYQEWLRAFPSAPRWATRRAFQDLPLQFGKTFTLYRYYRGV